MVRIHSTYTPTISFIQCCPCSNRLNMTPYRIGWWCSMTCWKSQSHSTISTVVCGEWNSKCTANILIIPAGMWFREELLQYDMRMWNEWDKWNKTNKASGRFLEILQHSVLSVAKDKRDILCSHQTEEDLVAPFYGFTFCICPSVYNMCQQTERAEQPKSYVASQSICAAFLPT